MVRHGASKPLASRGPEARQFLTQPQPALLSLVPGAFDDVWAPGDAAAARDVIDELFSRCKPIACIAVLAPKVICSSVAIASETVANESAIRTRDVVDQMVDFALRRLARSRRACTNEEENEGDANTQGNNQPAVTA